jgi:cell division protein FtsB|tara:strand:+ start:284 stop:472 length:189 start_codon:yes stop_codon:yes gene_type:complete
LILLSPIFVCILGFGGAQYLGVVNEGEDQSAFLHRLNNGLNKENEDLKRKVAQLQKQLEPQA